MATKELMDNAELNVKIINCALKKRGYSDDFITALKSKDFNCRKCAYYIRPTSMRMGNIGTCELKMEILEDKMLYDFCDDVKIKRSEKT